MVEHPGDVVSPPRNAVRLKKVDVDGVEIFYREAGDPASPALLILHGWPMSSHTYRHYLPLLAEKYYVVAPDYPSFGFSAIPDPKDYAYTFDNIASTVLGFTDAIGLSEYALQIFDYGALVGWRIAIARPERVWAIVSQNGPAYEDGVVNTEEEGTKELIDYLNDPNEERRQAMQEVFSLEYTQYSYFTGVPNPDVIPPEAWMLDYALLQRPGVSDIHLDILVDYARTLLNKFPIYQQYLRDHQPPVLAVWGENDPYFGAQSARAFERDVEDLELHFYDTGHNAIETHGVEIAEVVDAFLTRVRSTGNQSSDLPKRDV